MSTINITDARSHLPELIAVAELEPVFIERRGRRAAVLVSPERYEQMLAALEEVEDIAAFDAAMAEEGANIPWAQVKVDLGWV
ncbi:type II toxin-antitoxin system Phd/YefM family antitoxin [Arthrobacter sp. CG_A4]|uniref:type II toxin-antitoxin system Phd/YefM family antitoxin n=1 Tax=Arthrobacter sp. CG_A4 TaxID=3071706 RepID=UPI002DFD7AD3|nr:antitoxin Phd [Arthrobacter sp. CG_A4]